MSKYIIQKAVDPKDISAKAVRAMAGREYDIQPKYDGCHMVVVWDNTKQTVTGYSATGELVKSCDHIIRQLRGQLGNVLPFAEGFAVCGEVWHPTKKFPAISGNFRRHSPSPCLKFAPFDIVEVKDGVLDDGRPYRDRVRPLKLLGYPGAGGLVPFNQYILDGTEDTGGIALAWKELGGYDGAVMHDLDAPYKVGRCRNGEVIKVKPLLELDLLVVGCDLARGEKTGKNTAALVVRLRDDLLGRVSTGLTQEQVDSIHSAFDEQWSNKIIAVEAMGWTEDGLLREPRFKGIRYDKVEPDY